MFHALKVKYRNQAEIIDNDNIVTNLFLMCVKLYKSELMEAQVEEEVNGTNIMYENVITCMHVVLESSGKGVMHVD